MYESFNNQHFTAYRFPYPNFPYNSLNQPYQLMNGYMNQYPLNGIPFQGNQAMPLPTQNQFPNQFPTQNVNQFQNPYPSPFYNPNQMGFQSIMSQFKSQDGKYDFNKIMNTTGQMVGAVNQISSLIKGLSQTFKGF